MNVHAADLLEQSLDATDTAEDLPSADDLIDAFEELLERQEDVYDQIYLPCLGIGERFDVHSHEVELDDETWQFRGGEIWLFDAHGRQSWLHAPLLAPFEDLDDTLTLVRRGDVPPEIADRLRPPVVAGVRQALSELDWLVADTGGYEGGRMKHDEFLDEIGDRRWYRIDHDPKTSAARFEHWRGEEAQTGWTANVYDAFECELNLGSGWDSPVTIVDRWTTNPDEQPFETAVALDLLDDPYAQLRRLVWHDAHLDIDRLGPLVTWKDRPDALFEFNDAEDRLLADVAEWFSDQFEIVRSPFEELVVDWFERICDTMRAGDPVEIPHIGTVYEVTVPAVELIRPRPLMGAEAERTTRLERLRTFAASTDDPDDWYA
jgi:hypothetical protein